jgi:type 1 fimbria pilin
MRNIILAIITFICFSIFGGVQSFADEGNNQMQMQFGGTVSIPTCKLVIADKVVTLPSVLVTDFSPLSPGEYLAEKEFSVSVGNCSGGPETISEIHLTFEPKNGVFDDKYPAFINQAGLSISPKATGVGAVIVDKRNGSNVIKNNFEPYILRYETIFYPVGTYYLFVAKYIKTGATVTSGYFSSEVIITASYS